MTRANTYLDYNASAPLLPDVKAAIVGALEIEGNPSSVHRDGRRARHMIEQARKQIAELIHTDPQNIVFTSGGTEANNLAIDGLIRNKLIDRIIFSDIEHPSVREAITTWAKAGIEIVKIKCERSGKVDPELFRRALEASGDKAASTLVCLMAANNETGVLQDIELVSKITQEFNAYMFSDAVQIVCKMPIHFDQLGIHLMSISAHKFGGPKGVGALVVSKGIDLAPSLRGGGQELRHRAGTENLSGIVGFGEAAKHAAGRFDRWSKTSAQRSEMETRIREIVPTVKIFGGTQERLPNTSCFACSALSAEQLVIAMDLKGFSISAGSACSSGKVATNSVLAAMGVAPEEAAGAIRISLGPETTKEDVQRFVQAWSDFYHKHHEENFQKSA